MDKLKIACFFPLSSGVANKTDYASGMLKALQRIGYSVTIFHSPAARVDSDELFYADNATCYDLKEDSLEKIIRDASSADIIFKIAGKGIMDELLEAAVVNMKAQGKIVIRWSFENVSPDSNNVFSSCNDFDLHVLSNYDCSFIPQANVIPLGNAADISQYHPVNRSEFFSSALTFIADAGTVSPVYLKNYFLDNARKFVHKTFLLVGKGWENHQLPINVRYISEYSKGDLLKIYSSAQCIFFYNTEKFNFNFTQSVLNCCCTGTSVVTNSEKGLDAYLKVNEDYLLASCPYDLEQVIRNSSPEKLRNVAESAIRRILTQHTYNHRALLIHKKIEALRNNKIHI